MQTKKMSSKSAARWLIIAILLALISCIGASIIQTDHGKVSVQEIKIPVDGGRWIAGTLYKPASATADTPAPMVITCHGYLNNSEMQDSIAIELSRRGVSVIAMDAYFHGGSSGTDVSVIESCMADGTGMIPLVEYAYNELDYVDNSRIGVMGHSMGGMNVWMTCINYGMQQKMALAAAAEADSPGGAEITEEELAAANALNKVNAGLASGFVALSNDEMCAMLGSNFAINYSYYDEGNYALANGNADLSGACPESLSLVNSIMPEGEKLSEVEVDKFYGSAENKTLRVVFNPKLTHETQHFSKLATAQDLNFFLTSFGMEDSVGEGQVWLTKEIFNAIGMIACILAIVPIAVLLLETPAFASLKRDIPAPLPALDTGRRKLMFWGGWVLSWVISWVSFMPLTTLDTKLFPATAGMGIVSAFPQQTQNNIMIWAVFNAAVGLILYLIARGSGKKDGVTEEMRGIKIGLSDFLKTLALALCVFICFYAFVFAAQYVFNTDYRFYVIAICGFTADKLLVAAQYLPFFFLFFAVNSILTNSVNRIAGQKEGLNLFLCALGNALGVLLVNVCQYVTLFSSGLALYGETRLYPMAAIPLILWLFVSAYVSRALFKATGKVWLGALVNTLIIVMISVANSATLLAL